MKTASALSRSPNDLSAVYLCPFNVQGPYVQLAFSLADGDWCYFAVIWLLAAKQLSTNVALKDATARASARVAISLILS
ncbi:hypothetical protein thsrh120_59530 [Rhizobium sp. No.120]